jgi:hypothetical protein
MLGHEMFSSMRRDALVSDRMRATSHVLVERAAADVDDDDVAPSAQLRQLLAHEPVDADALQADRVQHAGGRLDDARRRVAFALGEEQALDDDGAERREVDDARRTRRRSRSSRSRR